MDDKQILALYWQRSEDAISETHKKYGRYCHHIAHCVLQNQEDADECVNDACLRAWNAIPPARPENLRTFLGKITRNLALNRYESRCAEKRGGGQIPLVLEELQACLSGHSESEQVVDRIVLQQILNRFLASLKTEHRKIFLRRYWYFHSVKEIARDLRISESKVTVTLCRTRQKLAELLKKEGVEL